MERQHSLLLVEDEDGLRRLVSEFLRAEGFRVVEAEDGPSAVERFRDSGPFDLALVDLNLPGFSGVEVCRRIRDARPAQPILICSAAILPDFAGALRELCIDQFLTKPFHPHTLLARIVGCLSPPRPHDPSGACAPKRPAGARRGPGRPADRAGVDLAGPWGST